MKRPAQRLLLATAGALLLHFALGVALWLAPRGPSREARRRAEAISIVLRPAPAPTAPPAVAPIAVPGRPAAPAQKGGLAVRPAAATPGAPPVAGSPGTGHLRDSAAARATGDAHAAAAPVAAGPTPEADGPARGTPSWKKAEGLLSDPVPTPLPLEAAPRPGLAFGISKTLRAPGASLGAYAREGLGAPSEGPAGMPVRVPSREEALAEEAVRVQARLSGYLDDFQARERVREVRDAYWQSVQDELEHGFEVKWEVRDGDHAPSAARRIAGEIVDQYRRELEAYGRSGSPLESGPGAPGGRQPLRDEFLTLAPEERGLRGTSLERPHAAMTLEALAAAGMGEGSPWHTRLVVRILLTQRTDGAVESARVAASSGNPIYDKLALDKALRLGTSGLLGSPPREHRRSLWAFDTDFLQMPPLPVAGCAFDGFMPAECFYPLKKKVHAGVHLEAVY